MQKTMLVRLESSEFNDRGQRSQKFLMTSEMSNVVAKEQSHNVFEKSFARRKHVIETFS